MFLKINNNKLRQINSPKTPTSARPALAHRLARLQHVWYANLGKLK